MELWNSLPIISLTHVPDLEREAMDLENKGIDPAAAIKLAHDNYIVQKMNDGAVFHLKSVQAFKNTEYQDSYNNHLALVALYKLKGFSFSGRQAQSLDRELLEPNPETIKHPSDVFVLKLGI
jgi:hypothetical protein